MQNSYRDPKVEGTTWTAESRAVAGEYIQEQIKAHETIIQEKIKAHESIIRYYMSRQNALTVTCQIPTEILGIIFEEVAKLAEKSNYDGPWNHMKKFRRVRNVSHVCSHWRCVALLTLNLWSDIPLEYPGCVQEMLQRSRMTPLTVAYRTTSQYTRKTPDSYVALKKILSSHLPRIRNLTLKFIKSQHNHSNVYAPSTLIRSGELLALLDQPVPLVERLELQLQQEEGSKPNKLPDGIIRELSSSSRLQHLMLDGCGMSWEFAAFGNLKSLDISHVPPSVMPSMPHLMGILSQTPLLEKLSLQDIEPTTGPRDAVPPWNAPQITLAHLECVTLSASPLSIMFLFDHLVFSKNARVFEICAITTSGHLVDNAFAFSVARLVQAIEKCVGGSITKLRLGSEGIKFWKSNISAMPPHGSLLFGPPAIDITFSDLGGKLPNGFLQSFCLDRLVSLYFERDKFATSTMWSFVGGLPQLQSLEVGCGDGPFLEAFRRCPSFTALTSLTINGWDLDTTQRLSKGLVDCLGLRLDAGLALEVLSIYNCLAVGICIRAELEGYSKKVDWDGEGGPREEESEDEYGYYEEGLYYRRSVEHGYLGHYH
ncbi:hypothetical protein DXG01_003184 [Tephrocybe rancida]|nr:hypothetical protein DXG01_003184 [Tephrocybe rancida]